MSASRMRRLESETLGSVSYTQTILEALDER